MGGTTGTLSSGRWLCQGNRQFRRSRSRAPLCQHWRWSNRDHPNSENTRSRSATRQVPYWHCRGQPASRLALAPSKQRQRLESLGDTRGCRSPVGTEARGQEAAEEEEEAAGLVTPRAGTASWYWLGSQYQLWGCLGSPPAPHPHP